MHNNKSYKKRKKTGKVILLFTSYLLICAAIVGIFFIQKKKSRESGDPLALKESNVISNESSSENPNSTNTKSVEANQNIADGTWCLTLVNKWHPLGSSNDIKTVELTNGERVDKRIYPSLQKMFDAARKDGVYPIVASGYRTQKEQQKIYDDKIDEYKKEGLSKDEAKEEAELWVALPGTSEHQLGLAVDINADGVHSKGQEVYNWLIDHAHLYGFINRYPADKFELTGVANEPWHYRYVGIKAAKEIYEQNVCLEEYLK